MDRTIWIELWGEIRSNEKGGPFEGPPCTAIRLICKRVPESCLDVPGWHQGVQV